MEVIGTLSLRASVDHPSWLVITAAGYIMAFFLLFQSLKAGMAIAVAYGLWGALGVALTAIFGSMIFHEVLSFPKIAGIAVIIIGVLFVEFGSRSPHSGGTGRAK